MKDLKRISKKVAEFCELSNYDIDKVKEAMKMKSNSFAIQKCENKREMENEGVDFSFPYVIFNPYNLDILIKTC